MNMKYTGTKEELARLFDTLANTAERDAGGDGKRVTRAFANGCKYAYRDAATIAKQWTATGDRSADLLKALDDLMQYTGGWDSPVTHPCGRAAALLKELGVNRG